MGVLTWFEIPASDLARATAFYEAVLERALVPEDIGDGRPKSLIPDGGRMAGALSHGGDWVPSDHGVIVYLDGGDDLQGLLDRVVAAGGAIVEPKQTVDATSGWWARFTDTEGNIIGVLSPH
ncbi:VOC family protein [Demequina silvatica]|uniref:VOC family protein n=1 Tax=Demequina silvatica TaxID=1638988 RepID=UPI000783B38F|nr:VOC family protein [Demequina silvatica]